MGRLRRLYERHLLPRCLELAMRPLHVYRGQTLAAARGRVLEVGFGTGLNLSCYPPGVEHLTGVDPLDPAGDRVQRRIAGAPFPVDHHALAADGGLPFRAASFDCVTVTWTLCTIAEPVRALREMRRVARPGARLLFIEHGRSDDPAVARWQDRMNGVQRLVAGGCNLNRRIDERIEAAGFRLERLDRFDAPALPRAIGRLYRGVAAAKPASAAPGRRPSAPGSARGSRAESRS